MMDKINVGLYGGKSIFSKKETPLRAEVIYCDRYDKCSLYKDGKCLNVTMPFSGRCKFGKIETIHGYTSRARKYSEFRGRYQDDECYSRLRYPSHLNFAIIDDHAIIKVPNIKVKILEDGRIDVITILMGDCTSTIPVKMIDTTLINRIMNCRPRDFNGALIDLTKDRRNFLCELKHSLPDVFAEYAKDHPEYADIEPDNRGRYAFIETMKDGSILKDNNGTYLLQNGKLTCNEWRSPFVPLNGKKASVTIDVTPDMTYKIDSNAQCDANTRFKD